MDLTQNKSASQKPCTPYLMLNVLFWYYGGKFEFSFRDSSLRIVYQLYALRRRCGMRNKRNVILRMPSVCVMGDCLSVVTEIVRVCCKMKLFLSLAVALFMINRGTTSECPPG